MASSTHRAKQHTRLDSAWQNIEHWQIKHDNGNGRMRVRCSDQIVAANIYLQPPEHNGDGTVPEVSALAPVKLGKIKMHFRQSGYEHQNSYKDTNAINATLYAICRIALDEFNWWKG